MQDLFTYETAKLMKQFTWEKLPDRFKHYFTYFSKVHTYFSRSSPKDNLFLPRYSMNKIKNCIKYFESKIRNKVVPENFNKLSNHRFKSVFKQFLLTKHE